MGLKQMLAMLVSLAFIGGYWWFKTGRFGGTEGYLKNKLGLRDGEQIASMWACVGQLDASLAKRIGHDSYRLHVGPFGMTLAITSASRLTIGSDLISNMPIAFERGQVGVSEHPERRSAGGVNTLAGAHGLEPTVVMALTPVGGEPFFLEIACSGFDAVFAWSKGA